MSSRRTERMASSIREELMKLLIQDVSDPALRDLSITEVEVTGDLRTAKVFYDTLEGKDLTPKRKSEIEKGFKRASPFFKRKMAQALQSKFTPELKFQHDTHSDDISHLFKVIDDASDAGSMVH